MVSGMVVTCNNCLPGTNGAYLINHLEQTGGDDMRVTNLLKDGSVMPYGGYVHPVLSFGI